MMEGLGYQTSEAVFGKSKSAGSFIHGPPDYFRKVKCTSPSGEAFDEDIPGLHEQTPHSVSSNVPIAPYLADENGDWEVELSYPESVASSITHGDFVGSKSMKYNLRVTEDSTTLPVHHPPKTVAIDMSLTAHVPTKSRGSLTRPSEEDSVLLTSSASLAPEEFELSQQPVQAQVQYHRRKKLEWKLRPNSEPRTPENHPAPSRNSWTIYDDLLEDLEDSIGPINSHQRDRSSAHLDTSVSTNCLGASASKEVCEAIEQYLRKKFLTFEYAPNSSLQYDNPDKRKTFTEMATMTDGDEKEEEDDSWYTPPKPQCIPLCRCMPKRTSGKRIR